MFKIKVPASTANLGSGFDVVGMAISIYNEMELDIDRSASLTINIEGEGANELPCDESNLVYQGIAEVFKRADEEIPGLKLNLHNNIPLESGLGSSASAIIGGLVLGNRLLRNRYSSKQILSLAADLEGHADNVSAALFGGLTLCSYNGNDLVCNVRRIPQDLHAVIVIPDYRVPTENARRVLPETVNLEDAIFNSGRTALLVSALTTGNYELLRVAMEDRLHQPYRFHLLPGMKEAINHVYDADAFGAAISGSGPALICFAWEDLESIGKAASEAFNNAGYSSKIVFTQPSVNGVIIIE